MVICSDKLTFLLRVLDRERFFGLILTPDGNLGKGRYLMRMAADDILRAVGTQ